MLSIHIYSVCGFIWNNYPPQTLKETLKNLGDINEFNLKLYKTI